MLSVEFSVNFRMNDDITDDEINGMEVVRTLSCFSHSNSLDLDGRYFEIGYINSILNICKCERFSENCIRFCFLVMVIHEENSWLSHKYFWMTVIAYL